MRGPLHTNPVLEYESVFHQPQNEEQLETPMGEPVLMHPPHHDQTYSQQAFTVAAPHGGTVPESTDSEKRRFVVQIPNVLFVLLILLIVCVIVFIVNKLSSSLKLNLDFSAVLCFALLLCVVICCRSNASRTPTLVKMIEI